MSPQPDEKKLAIMAILDKLRLYTPRIGSYVKSIYTTDFDYSIKLSNGRIRLPEELIDDQERAPGQISAERFRSAASRFIPNEPEVITAPAIPPVTTYKAPKRTSNNWIKIAIVVILVIVGYYWFQSAHQDNVQAAARVNIYNQVSVEGSSYKVNRLLGGISDLRITVTNNSDYLVDIVKVKVSYIKTNGGIYKDEILYFNQLGAHSTQTLNAPKSDRGTKVRIATESLTCAALQMN